MLGPELGTRDKATFEYDGFGNLVEASVTHEMIGGAITLGVTLERYIIPVDAADPEPVIQLIPTYTDDLAKITCYQLPNFAPSGSTYAIDREDFQVL